MDTKAVLFVPLGFWSAGVAGQGLPMPPRFTLDSEPDEVLRSYLPGLITELAAHSHHGHPDHKITLPNGLEGWVYKVYGVGEGATYVDPNGAGRICVPTAFPGIG